MTIRVFKVEGDSMRPSYLPGDFVLVWSAQWQRIEVDDVLVVNHPEFGKIIKRVSCVLPCGKVRLKGDNFLASTTASALGDCGPEDYIGKVVWRLTSGRTH